MLWPEPQARDLNSPGDLRRLPPGQDTSTAFAAASLPRRTKNLSVDATPVLFSCLPGPNPFGLLTRPDCRYGLLKISFTIALLSFSTGIAVVDSLAKPLG